MVLSERTYVNHFYMYYESSAGIMTHQVLCWLKHFQLEFKLYSSIVQPVFILIVIFLNQKHLQVHHGVNVNIPNSGLIMWYPKNHQTFKTTHRKHAWMGKMVDNGTCMYPKWASSLKNLEVKVVRMWTHNTLWLSIHLTWSFLGINWS